MYYYMFYEHNNITCVYIDVNLFKQNKLNKNHREINMRTFNCETFKILRLFIRHIHSKETNENATRKQSFLEHINVSYRACLQKTQSYVYALKLPSEVKMFSHSKKVCH